MQAGRLTGSQEGRLTDRWRDRKTHGKAVRLAERETDRPAGRQADGQTER